MRAFGSNGGRAGARPRSCPVWSLPVVLSYRRWKVRAMFGRTWVELYVSGPGIRGIRLLGVGRRELWVRICQLPLEQQIMGVFDSIVGFSGPSAGGREPSDDEFKKKYPSLFELMTATKYPDGKDRLPSSITVFCEDGLFKGVLAEKTAELNLWGTGATLKALLGTLEARLAEPKPDWRRSAASRKKR